MNDPRDLDEFLLTSAVARLAGVASATVHDWAKNKRLPYVTTSSGVRLFKRSDVERLKAERAREKRRTMSSKKVPA